MSNPKRFLYIGIVFIAVAVVEMTAFKFSTLGVSLGAVFFILGLAFLARYRRDQR